MTRAPLDRLTVEGDWNRDTLFAHPLSDITAYVRAVSWTWGMVQDDQMLAPPMQATITLSNETGAWNPGRADALFTALCKPNTLVRLRHPGNTQSDNVILQGRIQRLQVTPGQFGPRTAQLIITDWSNEMQQVIYDPPFATNTSPGAALAQMFATAVAPIPYADYWWVMDAEALGTGTRLFDSSAYVDIDSAVNVALPWVGDNLDAGGLGVNAAAFAEEMCVAEMSGRLWYHPALRKVIYRGRNWWAQNWNASLALNITGADILQESEYIRRDPVNYFELICYPRAVGAAGTTLFSIGSPIRINRGEVRQINARFRDPNSPEKSCGATTIVPLVAGTDYVANTRSDGTGSVVTSNVGISYEQQMGALRMNISNNSSSDDLFLTTLQVRGTPLTTGDAVHITSVSASSIAAYGTWKESRVLGSTGDLEQVQQFADLYVNRYGNPVTGWSRVVLNVEDSGPGYELAIARAHQLNLPLRISDAWTESPSAEYYWAAGVSQTIDVDSGTWTISLLVEQITRQTSWRLALTQEVVILQSPPPGALGTSFLQTYNASTITEAAFSILDVTTTLGF